MSNELSRSTMVEPTNLYQCPWYYGKINRQEAELHLTDRGENEGCFLVRESQSRAGQLTLSVLDWEDGQCKVDHFLINQDINNQLYLEERVKFHSVVDLIEFYKKNSGNVIFKLTDACPPKSCIPTKDEDDYELYDVKTELPIGEKFYQETLISTGSFSTVWKGRLHLRNTIKVVAKIENDCADSRHMLINEANFLKFLKHENIVSLRGVLSQTGKFHLVLEDAGDTDLVNFLLSNRHDPLTILEKLKISIQIATALEYCENMKCVHRNIKAKSVVIVSSKLKCHLASFKNAKALDKHGYYHAPNTDGEYVTSDSSRVRWMSPEAARNGRFSIASDVWSFAITMYEIFTNGELPYAGYLTCKVLEDVEKGFRNAKPQYCPMEIYNLMHLCWMPLENDRPRFSVIKGMLTKYVEDNYERLQKISPTKTRGVSRYDQWRGESVKQKRTTVRSAAQPPLVTPRHTLLCEPPLHE